MADIFVSYTSSDRDWAFWIGHELEALGHSAHIHDWEISGGGNIAAWMEGRHHNADRVLCVISGAYLEKPYSKLERQSGQWAAITTRPNFVLPVFIEPCEAPTLLAPLNGLVYCTGRDITRQIEQQEALKQAEDTLRQSQKMEAVGQLTGGHGSAPRRPDAAVRRLTS